MKGKKDLPKAEGMVTEGHKRVEEVAKKMNEAETLPTAK